MGGSKARRARREAIFGKSLKKRKLEAKQAAQAAAASRQKAGDDFISLDTAPADVEVPKVDKKSKKRKNRDDDDAENGTTKAAKTSNEADGGVIADGEVAAFQKAAGNEAGVQLDGGAEGEKPAKKPRRPAKVKPEGESEGSKNRFICFVGNLPFSITQKKVEAHFASLQPKSIRMATDKKGKHGKGYGFIEFNDYDRMKTCLEKFHHSEIEDPTGKAMRKINIELTAGGGGHHSLDRKSKIQIKNMRLQEQRERRKKLAEERKTKGKTPTERALEKKAKREAAEKAAGEAAGAVTAPVSAPSNGELFTMDGEGVHPSRLARMQG